LENWHCHPLGDVSIAKGVEVGMSRIYGGFHFKFDEGQGKTIPAENLPSGPLSGLEVNTP
jgi:hypothetical protein